MTSSSEQANTALALEAGDVSRATFQELGIRWAGMIVHQDQESIYTGNGRTGARLLADRSELS
jgi:hypothetical protein